MTLSSIKRLKYQQEINLGRGLKARGNKDGSASFLFSMKMRGKTSPIRIKIGTWPDISIDGAEDKARIYRAKVAEGIHPKDYEAEQALLKAKEEAEEMAKEVTLKDLLTMYEKSKEIFGRPNAPRTIADRRNGVSSVFAEWLNKPIAEITKQVVLDKIDEWSSQKGSNGQVLKVCAYMGAMYNFAVTMDLLKSNPFDIRKGRVTRGGNKIVTHYLEIKECEKLFKWIEQLKRPVANSNLIKKTFGDDEYLATCKLQRQMQFDAIALTLLTGLRKEEVLTLRWDQVYLTENEWGSSKGAYFEFIKSKQQEPMGVPITDNMMPYFESCMERRNIMPNDRLRNSAFLFPSIRTDKSITTTRLAYDQFNVAMPDLLKAPEVGAQVLRKTFATTAYSLGYNYEQIGLFTGHTSAVTNTKVATDYYVRRQADDHRSGFEKINSAIVGDTKVELVPLPPKHGEIVEIERGVLVQNLGDKGVIKHDFTGGRPTVEWMKNTDNWWK